MKTVSLILIVSLLTTVSHSQIKSMDGYYPENVLYRKLRVKSIIDTNASPPGHYYKKEFDTIGRQIAWYYIEDSVRTYFKYEKRGDTLIRLHFNTVNGREKPVYQFEKFLYNDKGKVELYQSCRRNYGSDDHTTQCEMSKFYYDDKSKLLTKLDYSESKYKKKFSENMPLVDTLMRLVDVNHYFYDKGSRLIAKKQMTGRPEYRTIDSFFYDKSNRLVKTTSFQRQGYLGEFAVGDLKGFEHIKYEKTGIVITSFITYRDWEITKLKTSEAEINQYVYEPNGLLKIRYHQSGSGKKSMLTYNLYEFY